jgi:hypothetical protein
MTPEELKLLQDTVKKLDAFLDIYYRTHFIDKDVFNNKVYFRNDLYLPTKTAFFGSLTPIAKQSAISTPSGGATVDSQARTAINSLISTLQSLGLTL